MDGSWQHGLKLQPWRAVQREIDCQVKPSRIRPLKNDFSRSAFQVLLG
jgi:hypothetical protein